MNAPIARPMVVNRSASGAGKTKGQRSGGGGGGSAGSDVVAASAPPAKAVRVMTDEAVAIDGMRTLSPEEQKRRDFTSKFHPSVLAVIDRLKDPKASPGADEAKFIRNGKAEVQIWLTEKTGETMAKLKELGFEVVLDPKTAKLVIGRIAIEKLAALAELKGVRYVGPQITSN